MMMELDFFYSLRLDMEWNYALHDADNEEKKEFPFDDITQAQGKLLLLEE